MANKYNLPHDTKYKVISSNYLSLENGGGTQCDNCNKIITTTVQVEDTEGNSIIHKARRFGSSYMLRKFMAYINELNKPKLLLPILAKSLWLKDNGYNNTWFSNQLYKKACFIEIKDSLYYQITNRYNNMAYVNQLIEDGKQCAECDVVYERPHWQKVLCVDCFEEKLKNGEVPEFQKASGVEL